MRLVAFVMAVTIAALPVRAQAPDTARIAQQVKAMEALAFLDGEWSGPAEARERSGVIKMTQTERVGSLLGGTVKLVEGRAYDDKGATVFNAFAVISYDVARASYAISSYAGGYVTRSDITLTGNGFEWSVPAGPGARMMFKATIQGGSWNEVGDFVGPDGAKRRTFEMNVRRLGPSAWPLGTPVAPKR